VGVAVGHMYDILAMHLACSAFRAARARDRMYWFCFVMYEVKGPSVVVDIVRRRGDDEVVQRQPRTRSAGPVRFSLRDPIGWLGRTF
jgi:hypothetical protein